MADPIEATITDHNLDKLKKRAIPKKPEHRVGRNCHLEIQIPKKNGQPDLDNAKIACVGTCRGGRKGDCAPVKKALTKKRETVRCPCSDDEICDLTVDIVNEPDKKPEIESADCLGDCAAFCTLIVEDTATAITFFCLCLTG